jgi:assimilatory nitrate reductase catalytic subunit
LKELSAGQPCDITGIADYRMLDELGGIQWPCTPNDAATLKCDASERRLFADGRFFHPDGRAKFIFEEPRLQIEPADAEYPFTLLTGRGTASQWHTQTRTSKSAILRKLYPQDAYLEIHSADAAAIGVADGGMLQVTSRRGSIRLRAVITSTVRQGQVFAPMHYDCVNQLTQPVFDPYSRQPSYKACAVSVTTLDGRQNSSGIPHSALSNSGK